MPKEKTLLITKPIKIEEINKLLWIFFDNFVKAVVDVKNWFMAINAELHADEEQFLLDHGSQQDDLRGINLYPENFWNADWIEFDSMINIRPRQGNRTRSVLDVNIQEKIVYIVNALIQK